MCFQQVFVLDGYFSVSGIGDTGNWYTMSSAGSLVKKLAPSTSNSSVGVLGAGISGLTFAFFLNKLRPDVQITILEKSGSTGGYINSKKIKTEEFDSRVSNDFTVLEKGPRTLRGGNPGTLLLIDIMHKLKSKQDILGLHKTSNSNKRYLLSPYVDTQGNSGKLAQVPDGIVSFWKFLFDPLGRQLIWGVLKEPFVKRKTSDSEETVEQFITRRFNKSLSDNIVSALMHGIYAGDASKLSAKAVLPKLVELEQEHGSIVKYGLKQAYNELKSIREEKKYGLTDPNLIKYQDLLKPSFNLLKTSQFLKNFPMVSVNNGLQTLTDTITNYLSKQENVKIIYNVDLVKIAPNGEEGVSVTTTDGEILNFNHFRSTINALELSKLVKSEDEALSNKLDQFKYTNVVLANVYIPHLSVKSIEGFGYLVPKAMIDGSDVIGVIFDSDVERSSKKLFFYNDVDVALGDLRNSAEIDSHDVKSLKVLSNTVAKRGLVVTNEYTKVTFMIGGHLIKDLDDMPTNSKVQKTIKDVFESKLKIRLHNVSDMHVDITHIDNCIPQYEVGYLDLKKDVLKSINEEFNGNLSLGGMTFSNGVGVPDVTMNSFLDVAAMCGK